MRLLQVPSLRRHVLNGIALGQDGAQGRHRPWLLFRHGPLSTVLYREGRRGYGDGLLLWVIADIDLLRVMRVPRPQGRRAAQRVLGVGVMALKSGLRAGNSGIVDEGT
jgi:hypothetical protein